MMGQSDSHGDGAEGGLEVTEGNFRKLLDEITSLKAALRERDGEVERLSRIRDDMEAEIEDLTASLFEEAHKMVRDAMVKQAFAEKLLVEANMKVDGLQTEVAALKTLVLTSTPSQPNKHLHPQIDPKNNKKSKGKGGKDVVDGNGVSHSPRSLQNGKIGIGLGSNSSLSSPQSSLVLNSGAASTSSSMSSASNGGGEDQGPVNHIDPVLRKEYLSWKKSPSMDRSGHPFVERIYCEEIDRCLDFANKKAAEAVSRAVHNNTLCINPVTDFSKVPRDCTLLEAPVLCRFYVQLGDEKKTDEESFYISQLSRNRIAAVCDCLNYLRYIKQGLVKSHVNDVYWEIMHLRSKMALARFGYSSE
jgi:Rab-3A-interacting protein